MSDASIDPAAPGLIPATPRPGRRPRWRLYVFLVVLLALLGWFGRFAWLRITLKPTPRPEYWAAELRRHFPSPPDGVPLRDVDAILQSCPTTMVWLGSPVQNADFRGRRAHMRELEQRVGFDERFFKDVFDAFVQVLDRPWAVGDMADVRNGSLDHWMTQTSGWHELLLAHANWHLRNNRLSEARTDLLRCLKLARHMLDQPALGLHLYGCLTQKDVGWYILNAASDPEHRLTADPAFIVEARSLVGELVTFERLSLIGRFECIQALEEVYVREGAGWLDVSEAASRRWRRLAGISVSRWWNLASPLFYSYAEARQRVEMSYKESDDGSAPQEQPLEWLSVLDGGGVLNSLESRRLERAGVLGTGRNDALTHMEAALAALAIGHYQQLHQKLPQDLNELVPSILPAVPRDYHGNRPLSYRIAPESKQGFMLYTFGNDGVDGGGAELQKSGEGDMILFPQPLWR